MYAGREDLTPDNYLSEVAVETHKRTLLEAIEGADVFLGLSVSHHMCSPVCVECAVSHHGQCHAHLGLSYTGRRQHPLCCRRVGASLQVLHCISCAMLACTKTSLKSLKFLRSDKCMACCLLLLLCPAGGQPAEA